MPGIFLVLTASCAPGQECRAGGHCAPIACTECHPDNTAGGHPGGGLQLTFANATAADLAHVVEVFRGAFDSLWADPEFETDYSGLMLRAGLAFYNVTPARLFLGDSGSQLLGFWLAGLGIIYTPARSVPQLSRRRPQPVPGAPGSAPAPVAQLHGIHPEAKSGTFKVV